jgi:hypothetical protein
MHIYICVLICHTRYQRALAASAASICVCACVRACECVCVCVCLHRIDARNTPQVRASILHYTVQDLLLTLGHVSTCPRTSCSVFVCVCVCVRVCLCVRVRVYVPVRNERTLWTRIRSAGQSCTILCKIFCYPLSAFPHAGGPDSIQMYI